MLPGSFDSPVACLVWMAIVAILMASRIPTLAAKKLVIRHEWVLPIMLACGVVTVLVIIEPWIMLNVSGLIYCLMLPVGVLRYRRLAKEAKSV